MSPRRPVTAVLALALALALAAAPAVATAATPTPPGTLITVAGNGSDVASGDGGPALDAGLARPYDVESDAAGNLFLLDLTGAVRRVDARTRVITTVAGGGSSVDGDGGAATAARFNYPADLAVSPTTGDLYIAEAGSARIRKVDARTGIITTVLGADSLTYPYLVAVDRAGHVFVADGHQVEDDARRILRADPDGGVRTLATRADLPSATRPGPAIDLPQALAAAPDGSLYFSDLGTNLIRRITPDNAMTTVAGSESWGASTADGAPARFSQLLDVRALAFDTDGSLLIADSSNYRIMKLTTDGTVRKVAGISSFGISPDGTTARESLFCQFDGLTVTPDGTPVFTQWCSNSIRAVTPGGGLAPVPALITDVTALGLTDGRPWEQTRIRYPKGLTTGTDGAVYLADTNSSRIRRVDPNTGRTALVAGTGAFGFTGDGAALSTALNRPRGVAAEPGGTILIADTDNSRIRRLDPRTGTVTTVAGDGRWGYGGDGGPAPAASLAGPQGVAVAADGTVFIADTRNGRVRRIDAATGVITTVARSTHPRALLVRGDTVYVADDTEGTVYALAGGVLTPFAAGLRNPADMLADGTGLLIAEAGANRVIRVSGDGERSVVAGTGSPGVICKGYCGYLGPNSEGGALQVTLNQPQGLARTADGDVWITDSGHDRVVLLSPTQE